MFEVEAEDDGTPRAALDAAGQCVRQFNHQTGKRFRPDQEGWRFPSDAYSCLGELGYLVGMVPQVVQHLMSSVRAQQDDGHIAITWGEQYLGDPAGAVEETSVALERAIQSSYQLRAALDVAQSALSGASYAGPEVPDLEVVRAGGKAAKPGVARPAAAARSARGGVLDRDDMASHHTAALQAAGGHDAEGVSAAEVRLSLLSLPEAQAVAVLLAEYAATYPGEPISDLAHTMLVRLRDRIELS